MQTASGRMTRTATRADFRALFESSPRPCPADRAALQARQLARDILPDQIRPRAQHLAELDERGTNLAQREPDANGRAEIHDGLSGRPAQPLLHPLAGHLANVIGE